MQEFHKFLPCSDGKNTSAAQTISPSCTSLYITDNFSHRQAERAVRSRFPCQRLPDGTNPDTPGLWKSTTEGTVPVGRGVWGREMKSSGGVPPQHHSLSIRRRTETLCALPKSAAVSKNICIVKLQKSSLSYPAFKTVKVLRVKLLDCRLKVIYHTKRILSQIHSWHDWLQCSRLISAARGSALPQLVTSQFPF